MIFGLIGLFTCISAFRSSENCCEFKNMIGILVMTYMLLGVNFVLFNSVLFELLVTLCVVATIFSISYVTFNFLLCFIKCYIESFGLWLILFSHTVIFGLFLICTSLYLVFRLSGAIYKRKWSMNIVKIEDDELEEESKGN